MFKTLGRRGLNAKQITVVTNDPQNPRTSLFVRAHLEVELALEPTSADFGRVRRGSDMTQAVRLVGLDAAEVKVLAVEPGQVRAGAMRNVATDSIVRTSVRQDEDGSSVEIALAPDAPTGRFMGMLTVVTDHPRTSRLQLRVSGEVEGSIKVQPPRVQFRVGQPQEVQTSSLVVSSTGDDPYDVLEVGVDHPSLAATFTNAGVGRTRVELTLNGPLRRPRDSAVLRIRTSSAEDPLVEVPVDLFEMRPPPRPARPVPTSKN